MVYYFRAYADLVRRGTVAVGERVDYVVPTGNFGDILAGYFARELGLPVTDSGLVLPCGATCRWEKD